MQLKRDGARGRLRIVDGAPALRTRRGRRCDGEFTELPAAAASLPDVILEGEIILFGAPPTSPTPDKCVGDGTLFQPIPGRGLFLNALADRAVVAQQVTCQWTRRGGGR